jgi:peptidoglycan/LPS O-acetylase OafA/YrhL
MFRPGSSILNTELPQRSGTLDGLRGIAVCIVLLSHTSGRDMALHPSLNFQGIGHVGVYLFFCLSAYLLAGKLFDEGIDSGSVKRFYLKRILRILPLYYLVITGVFLYQYSTGHFDKSYLHIEHGFRGYLQHLLLYRGDSVFWSVVVEEQFYILVPFWVYLLLRFRTPAMIVFALVAVTNFILYTCKHLQWPVNSDMIRYITTNDRDSGNYIDIFICTILVVQLFRKYKPWFQKHRSIFVAAANTAFTVFMFLTLALVSKKFLFFDQAWYGFRFLSLPFAFVFSVFILSFELNNPLGKYIANPVLKRFGILGFSVYLLHFVVFQAVNNFDWHPALKFFISMGGILLLSSCTYYLVERPCIKLAYRLIDRFGWKEEKKEKTGESRVLAE